MTGSIVDLVTKQGASADRTAVSPLALVTLANGFAGC